MKKILLTVFVLYLSTGMTFGQTKKEKQVAAATEQLRIAMLDGNRAELEKLASGKLSYGHSGGLVE
ncbi:MAG TPA: nuclear transport factor 2 family protein, partial [Chitinophagaceae bacterium]|nr:nuclear transport factor 2 family protein [Chitinophagaceae bacterium]